MHELPWLPSTLPDFNERCSHIADSENLIDEVRLLANCCISINQSNRLARAINKLTDENRNKLSGAFSPFKLGLVSNATMDLFVPSFIVSALRKGILLDVITADFGQIAQEAFDPESVLNRAKPDAVLLALDYRAYSFSANALAMSNADCDSQEALGFLKNVRNAFMQNSGVICITQTLASPPFALAGSFDLQKDGMIRKEIQKFNTGLIEDLNTTSDILMDVSSLANQVGANDWFDERQWYMSKVPIANRFIPLYADYLSRQIAALRGKNKKCLVLDLDNTLWGGVIGDDGLDGIKIGQGNPIGEAHLAIQQYAAELKKLGVILAVCSKNEPDIAREPFRKHPDMLLKEKDFAVFVANWEDKASNIREIANMLNIGLDSLVFVDDNPAEREIVRTLVPEVAVPELPQDPSLIPRTLSAAGYFDIINLTSDDIKRSAQYAENVQREQIRQKSGSVDAYLASLDMKIAFSEFDELGRKRITQLINKTNQFNLTTKRYTEVEVRHFEKSNDAYTMQARLVDRFGDNGMISVIICKDVDDCWEIDTWLMSCRVIKRRVEESMCDRLVDAARKKGITKLRGIYRPTEKNKLVKEHYKGLGFSLVNTEHDEDIWELNISDYKQKNPPISII